MARRCSVERANKQIGGFASAKKNMVYYVVNQKIEGQIAF